MGAVAWPFIHQLWPR
nr:hypothetical protein [Bartonella quintana]